MLLFFVLPFLSSLHLIYELIHQLHLHRNHSKILNYFSESAHTRLAYFFASLPHSFKHFIEHSIQHTIKHLILEFSLVILAFAFVLIGLNRTIYMAISKRLSNIKMIAIRSFMGLNLYEMLLIYTEQTVFIFFEFVDYWNVFFNLDGWKNNTLWFIMVITVFAPLSTYFHIYIEKTYHSGAVFVMAAIQTYAGLLVPFLIYSIYIAIYKDTHTTYEIYNRISKSRLGCLPEIQAIKHECPPVIPDSLYFFVTQHVFIRYSGPLKDIKTYELERLILEFVQRVKLPLLLLNILFKAIVNFTFAGFLFIFQKLVLKKAALPMDGAFSFLIAEEFLTITCKRFFLAIFNPLEWLLARQFYSESTRNAALYGLLCCAICRHEMLAPSPAYRIFNGMKYAV